MNYKGVAILKPGQYKKSHKIGKHQGKYEALCQQNPVTVYRDKSRKDQILYPINEEKVKKYLTSKKEEPKIQLEDDCGCGG